MSVEWSKADDRPHPAMEFTRAILMELFALRWRTGKREPISFTSLWGVWRPMLEHGRKPLTPAEQVSARRGLRRTLASLARSGRLTYRGDAYVWAGKEDEREPA